MVRPKLDGAARSARMEFARRYADMPVSFWDRVFFVDEQRFRWVTISLFYIGLFDCIHIISVCGYIIYCLCKKIL